MDSNKAKLAAIASKQGRQPLPADLSFLYNTEAADATRAASIKPGEMHNIFVSIKVPADWSYAQITNTIEELYPGVDYKLRGPDTFDADGKKMLEYYCLLTKDISHLARNIEDYCCTDLP